MAVKQEILVTEQMAEFIAWVEDKGKEYIDNLVRMCLTERKENDGKIVDGKLIKWDAALEPNDGNDQWKHGGDCNKCRKLAYCKKQCRPNRELKAVTTPYLYADYVKEHPEVIAKYGKKGLDPNQLVKDLNLN